MSQVAGGREGEDLVFPGGQRLGKGGGAGGRHAGAADAAGHAQGQRMEQARCGQGHQAAHDAEEGGAQHGAGEVGAQDAAAFRGVQPVDIADQAEVRFAGDGVAGADDLAAQAEQDRQGHRDHDGAPVVADLLQEQRSAGLDDRGHGGPDGDAVAGHERQGGDDDEAGGVRRIF